MAEAVTAILQNADYFVLLLFRVGGLVIASPVFGRVNLPAMAKTGLVASLAFLFFLSGPAPAAVSYGSAVGFLILIVTEILIGVVMAFVTNIFFALTFTAGQMIDMQIGFGVVNVYDIQNNTQIPMIGNVLNLVLLIVFLMADGHLRLVEIMNVSVLRMPVGNLSLNPEAALALGEIFARSFALGVMVALPVIASGLVLEIAFGMLIRTVPQMNMFVVGIPLKLFVGLIMIYFVFPAFISFSDVLFGEMFEGIDRLFGFFYVSAGA